MWSLRSSAAQGHGLGEQFRTPKLHHLAVPRKVDERERRMFVMTLVLLQRARESVGRPAACARFSAGPLLGRRRVGQHDGSLANW